MGSTFEVGAFKEWLESNTSLKTPSINKYASAIGVVNDWYESAKRTALSSLDVDSLENAKNIIFRSENMGEQNKRGNQMYSAAFNKYIEYKRYELSITPVRGKVPPFPQANNLLLLLYGFQRSVMMASRSGDDSILGDLEAYWSAHPIGPREVSYLIHACKWLGLINESGCLTRTGESFAELSQESGEPYDCALFDSNKITRTQKDILLAPCFNILKEKPVFKDIISCKIGLNDVPRELEEMGFKESTAKRRASTVRAWLVLCRDFLEGRISEENLASPLLFSNEEKNSENISQPEKANPQKDQDCLATFIYDAMESLVPWKKELIVRCFSQSRVTARELWEELMTSGFRGKGVTISNIAEIVEDFEDELLSDENTHLLTSFNFALDDEFVEWGEISRKLDAELLSNDQRRAIIRCARILLSKKSYKKIQAEASRLIKSLASRLWSDKYFKAGLIDAEALCKYAERDGKGLLLESHSPEALFLEVAAIGVEEEFVSRENPIVNKKLVPSIKKNTKRKRIKKSSHAYIWYDWIRKLPGNLSPLSADIRVRSAIVNEMEESYNKYWQHSSQIDKAPLWAVAEKDIFYLLKCVEVDGKIHPAD